MQFACKTFCELTGAQVYEILKARQQIFMLEQEILCLDMDDKDYDSIHFFLEEEGKILAYMRAFYLDDSQATLKIGRVLSVNHGKGLGRQLMESAMQQIRSEGKAGSLFVHSQVQAAGFYEKMGFTAISEPFLEEGVWHVSMSRIL